MSEKKLNNMDVTTDTDRVSWDEEKVIEQVWKDFHGMVTRSTIEQLISEVIQKYKGALIRTYIPILVQKEVVDQLRAGLPVSTPDVESKSGSDHFADTLSELDAYSV